jgi:hypothetical protein
MLARSLFSGILLILAVMLIALANAAAASAQENEPICGSVEAFNRTHRWQDLPGCTEKRDYSDGRSPVTLFGRAKDAFKSFFENWEKGEIDAAKSDAGGALNYTNGAEDWDTNPELASAKPAYEEMRKRVAQYMEWAPLVEDLAQQYFKTVTWIGEAKKGVEDSASLAKSSALELQKSMQKAQAANVPDDFVVPGIGEVKPATIAELKQMIAPFIGQANAEVKREKDADDAKWRPFTSLLGGDRLKFFNETYRIGTNVYGTGGRYLDTPEEFRTATVMCTQSYTTDRVIEQWRVKCWSFRGNVQTSGPRVTTGYGSSAPSSAYR